MELKGMRRDENPAQQIKGTWRDARNVLVSKGFQSIENEAGLEDLSITFSYTPIGIVKFDKGFIIFSTDDTTSEIGIYKNNEYKVKIKSSYLGFKKDNPIEGVYKYNHKGEIIVAWCSGVHDTSATMYLVNLDDPAVELTAEKEFESEFEVELIKLFPAFNQPQYTLNDVRSSGGSLNSGVYYFSIKYLIDDNDYTNWTRISNPVTITDDHKSKDGSFISTFEKYDGCVANTSTTKVIDLNISGLDTRYPKFKLGVIGKNDGVYTAFELNSYTIKDGKNLYSSVDVEYSGNESSTEINLSEILTGSEYYDKGRTMAINNDKLVVGNVQTKDKLKYQKYANMINVNYTFANYVSLDSDQIDGTFKDAVTIFSRKTFMPGEVYAYFIGFPLKGGGYSPLYHIPGRVPEAADYASCEGQNYADQLDKIDEDHTFKFFQLDDTSEQLNLITGKMGYWENEDEKYPTTKDGDFNSTVDYDGEAISGGINIEGLNVRHHRFPTLSRLLTQGKQFMLGATGGTTEEYTASFGDIGYNSSSMNHKLKFNSGSVQGNIGHFVTQSGYENATFVAGKALTNVTVTYAISIYNPASTSITTEIYNNADQKDVDISFGTNAEISGTFTVASMAIGDTIRIIGFVQNTLASSTFEGFCTIEATAPISDEGTMSGRILGIRASNIQIPDEIKDQVLGYEIFYAKRTFSNSLVITQARKMDGDDTNYFTMHPFDLFINKSFPNIKPTHIVNEAYLNGMSSNDPANPEVYRIDKDDVFIHTYNEIDGFLSAVSEFKYLPLDNELTDPTNSNRETRVYGYADDGSFETGAESQLVLSTLYSFKRNLYYPYYEQDIVSTGVLNYLGSSSTHISTYIYGGDAYISMIGSRYLTGEDTEKYYYYPAYTSSNAGLRHEGDATLQEYYYPRHSNIDPTVVELDHENELDDYYGYNTDYSSVNDLNVHIIEEFNDNFVSDFPHRVITSNKAQSEEDGIGWRTFLSSSYYEMPKSKGEIVKVFSEANDLCISHRNALFVARLNEQMKINDDIVASLGNAQIFDTKPLEIIYDEDGYVGNQCQFSTIYCPIGALLIDRQQKKIFLYRNREVKELSKLGMINWFYGNVLYASASCLEDGVWLFDDSEEVLFDDSEEAIYSTGYEELEKCFNEDNPFNNKGYSAAWDDKNERLLITKRVYQDSTDYSYTISYSPNLNAWVAFHDYHPNIIVDNRDGVYSIDNNRKLYKHNHSNYSTFYGTVYKSYIDVVFNNPIGVNKLFESVNWESVVMNDTVREWDKTLTHIVIFNYNQHSNKTTLTKQTFTAGNIRNTDGTWKFNDFRDLLSDKDFGVIEDLEESILSEETLDASRLETTWSNKGRFIDTFIIVRLIYDNVDQNKMLINNVSVNKKIQNR